MNISKYDFHDGYLIGMYQLNDSIEITMESAEISDEELQDDIVLSDHNTIKGKLHLNEIKEFKINNKVLSGTFKKDYDEGTIYSFDIKSNNVTLIVSWINHPPKPYEETDLCRIEISVDHLFWENIPDLINPFW